MQCPKCFANMEAVDFNGVEVDRCTECYGLYFDSTEKETLKQMKGSEEIDIGDEFVGARFNEILDVGCPKCDAKMNHVFETEPFEIKFEVCPKCKGVFFDAGEFRDYMQDEIFDSFQDLMDNI